jgi:hypothetical protein
VEKALIEKALKKAIDSLIQSDFKLLLFDVNERSISHKLANYLEEHFNGWNVDCEYNRNGCDSKRLNIEAKNIKSNDNQGTTVFPDIIIHRRGIKDNLVVIELKKTTGQDEQYDLCKLKAFKDQLNYRCAIFIKVRTGKDFGIEISKWV